MRWRRRYGRQRVSQVEIGQLLGMSRRNVFGSIERLISYGLMLRDRKIGSLATYRIFPLIAHRGPYVQLHMGAAPGRGPAAPRRSV